MTIYVLTTMQVLVFNDASDIQYRPKLNDYVDKGECLLKFKGLYYRLLYVCKQRRCL